MESAKAFGQIRRVVRIVAATLGVAVSIAVPGGIGAVSYLDQMAITQFRAHLAADRLSSFAYIQGPTWVYSDHRIPELIAEIDPRGEALQTVFDAQGRPIARIGPALGALTMQASETISTGGEPLGSVMVESDLKGLLERLLAVGLFGMLLGLGVFFGVEVIPLRALREALARLGMAEVELRAKVARTELALQNMQHERTRAEEASQAKSEFVANMSHEFRTPLNAIIGFSDMLRHRMFGELSSRYREYADDIHRSGLHLLDIINDILDIAKIESGQLELHREPVPPREVIEDSIMVVSEAAARSGVRLSVAYADDLPEALPVDRVKIRQVLLNLLSNAIKFTPAGGKVSVTTAADETYLEIVIADAGIGMSPDEIATALQPFGQVASAYTRDHRGTGLGLPIADALVRQHHGTLRIESEPARGTTVTVRLPLAPGTGQRQESGSEPMSPPAPGSGRA